MSPSGRSLVGVFAVIALIVAFSIVVALASPLIDGWPVLAQMVVYLVLGIVWIFPAKPLIRWTVTGRFGASR